VSFVLFLFLAHLGIGIAWTLLLVHREAGVKFFRFNAGLAALLLVAAAALRPKPPGSGEIDLVWDIGLWLLYAAIVGLTLYWATIGRALAALRPGFLWLALLAGAGTILIHALVTSWPSESLVARGLTAASFITSAALLGGACTAMVLGHWYLILPSMEIGLLQRIVRFHLTSLVARVVLVACVVAAVAGGAMAARIDLAHYATSAAGVFLWQRVLFGLAGPAVLGWLTWETAKIRSTQSATGILYVDFFTVIVGEVLAKYLLMETSLPL
jgi:protein NrfD